MGRVRGRRQLTLDLQPPRTWGGKRAGAGRKRIAPRQRMPHRPRKQFAARLGQPVHVTLRVRPERSGMRRAKIYRAIRLTMLRSGHREHFRIVHYSIQGNHVHLVCEAADQRGLARGVQGFASAMARRINKLAGTSGRFFDDRYHMQLLTSPTQTRNALSYVLNNWRRHRIDHAGWRYDPFSSGELFAGFWPEGKPPARPPPWLAEDEPPPTATPRSWLLRTGWSRAGAISPFEVPVPGSSAG
jgi:hypothetical protein